MPDGLWGVVGLLTLGYLFLFVELFVPGGVLGILGGLSILYGCFLAFDLGPAWGVGSVLLSLAVTAGGLTLFLRSRASHRFILEERPISAAKAPDERLAGLLGQDGTTFTDLRPAGTAEFGDARIDVVTDGQHVSRGARVRVIEVEGVRVVVEPVEE